MNEILRVTGEIIEELSLYEEVKILKELLELENPANKSRWLMVAHSLINISAATVPERSRLFEEDMLRAMVFLKASIEADLLTPEELANQNIYESLDEGGIIPLSSIPELVREVKGRGYIVGFGHGHHRHPTLAHIIHFVEAIAYCDFLIWGLESNERTEKFKGVQPIHSDEERLDLYDSFPMLDAVALIAGDEYTDRFYQGLVQEIDPDLYFSMKGHERHDQRRQRVKGTNIRLVELTYFEEALSTSELLEMSLVES